MQNFSCQDLRNRDFSGQNLAGADFRGANLRGVKFVRANLRGAKFGMMQGQRTDGAGSDFSEADIRGASFKGHNIEPENIRSVEKKGNDVMLTVQVPPNTDKGQVEQDFFAVYEARLEAAKATALLEAE